MPAFLSSTRPGLALGVLLLLAQAPASAATSRLPADLAGTWDLTLTRSGAERGEANCRVMLRPQQSDKGDYFLGMPSACRHAMPLVASAGRWKMPDGDHILFDDPSGAAVLTLAAMGARFTATTGDGTYSLKLVAKTEASVVAFNVVDGQPAQGFAAVQPISKRSRAAVADRERPSDLAGRYAVLREKRDTGCMITLDDSARALGGDRAQLAPGCRDQGIVIFDPSAWMIVKGTLVLTARAGHKAILEKQGEGLWAKDAKDGGKPLGLKRL